MLGVTDEVRVGVIPLCAAKMAHRAARRPSRPALSYQHRKTPQPRRGRTAHRPLRSRSRHLLSIAPIQARDRAYAQAHRRHAVGTSATRSPAPTPPHRLRQRDRRHGDLRPRQSRRSGRCPGRADRRAPPARHDGRMVTGMAAVTVDVSSAADLPVGVRSSGPAQRDAADGHRAAGFPGGDAAPMRAADMRIDSRLDLLQFSRSQCAQTCWPMIKGSPVQIYRQIRCITITKRA